MQWDDKAIVLSVRRLGEHSAIIHVMTAGHGLYAGVDRGAFGKRKQGVYQPGNRVQAHWQARLPEHMGMLQGELLEAVAARLLDDRRKLAALTAATQMVERILAERDPQPQVYRRLEGLLEALCADEALVWKTAYVRLEMLLLESAGFGLDLLACAATGAQEGLHYVSPRTGRAVSREAGEPYHDRLFLLPSFLQNEGEREADRAALLEGLRLCGHFLSERVFLPRGVPMPASRTRFVSMLMGQTEAA